MISISLMMGQSTAQTAHPRHVNPAEISEEIPPGLLLLTIYRGVVEAVSIGNYTEAISRLGEAYRVYVPEPLRYIMRRFHELLQVEVSLLNETGTHIELARGLIELGFIRDAGEQLREASINLAKANLTHTELQSASQEFSRRIPIPIGDPLRSLTILIETYGLRIEELAGRLRGIQPTQTSLWIRVEEGEAWVGSQITLMGTLSTMDGMPLENRWATINLDGMQAAEVMTGPGGHFRTALRVPFIYKPELSIQALFKPKGPDIGTLAASRSNVIEVRLLYLTPTLKIEVDKGRILPTEDLTVIGLVDVPGLEVWARGFGRTLREVADERGSFKFTFRIPAEAAEGFQTLEIGTSARDLYAPARATARVEVYRYPLELEVEIPTLTLAGLPVGVRGHLQGPMGHVKGAVVRVEGFELMRAVETDGEGRFEVYLQVPLTQSSGWHQITVQAHPSEPHYRMPSMRRNLLILNPYLLIIPLTMVAILTRGLLSSRRPKPQGVEAEEAQPEAPRPVARELAGIPLIYLKAVEIVARATREELRPSDTVREYLERVRPKLGGALEPFERLTWILEEEVYGGLKPDISEATLLLEELQRNLGGLAP